MVSPAGPLPKNWGWSLVTVSPWLTLSKITQVVGVAEGVEISNFDPCEESAGRRKCW